MRMTQHHTTLQPKTLRPKTRKLFIGGALLLSLFVSGCSAVNMTGFSFPVFGLTKDSGDESDAKTPTALPEGEQRPGVTSGSLTAQ